MVGSPDYSDSQCGHKSTARPFAVGVLVGLRAWHLDENGILRGITYAQPWTPGENHARCYVTKFVDDGTTTAVQRHLRKQMRTMFAGIFGPSGWDFEAETPRLHGDDEVPDPCDGVEADCACGFYAYHDNALRGYTNLSGTDGRSVVGIVEGYGRIVVGPRGFRAQKARIVAMVIPRSTTAYAGGNQQLMMWRIARDVHAVNQKQAQLQLAQMSRLKRRLLPSKVERLQKTIVQEAANVATAEDRLTKHRTSLEDRWAACLTRYPGVQLYGSVDEMRAAHPSPDVSHFLADRAT